MVEGTIKFFDNTKGFGFINGGDGKDYYVNESAVEGNVTLDEGDKVSFNVVDGDRGPKADKVKKM